MDFMKNFDPIEIISKVDLKIICRKNKKKVTLMSNYTADETSHML